METLLLTAENFSVVQEELEHRLSSLNVAKKDSLRAQLLAEEIFWRTINYGHAAQVEVQPIKNFFGKVQIQMTAAGAPYNPLIEVSDWNEDGEDEDYFRMMILKANRQKLNWSHKQNRNVVTIDVRGESNRQLRLTVTCIVGGLVCGVLMKEFLSPEAIALVNEDVISPISTMFLNALKMVIAPVIFFSIISGITGMGAGASIGKIGSKLIGLYLATSAVASVVGLLIAIILFSGDVPQIGTIPSSGGEVSSYEFSMIQFIVGIIPNNLINPIANGNMLQIIFLAVLFGSCLNAFGDKVQLLQEIISNCNEFFLKVVGVIVEFVPLIVFFAMITMVFKMGVDTVLMMGKLIAGQLIGCGAMLGVYALLINFIGKISPLPFLKKIPEIWAVPFATSSSAVTMPLTMKFCADKMGISPKITSFSIPIGTTVNMDGSCIYLPTAIIMFLKMYGVEVDMHAIIIICAMTISLSVGIPAMPNAAVICILTVTALFGVPADIAGLLFCIGIICERIVTCLNVTGDIAASTILSRTENLFDEKIYFG